MIGDDQNGLRDHHRGRRKQQAQRAERARARQQQIDDQADDHGRQAHQRVQRHEQHLPPRKTTDRERGAERQADGGRGDDCGQAHFQAQ